MAYTNNDRAKDLEKVLKAFKRYDSPFEAMGDMPDGIDADIYKMFVGLQEVIEERLATVYDLDPEEVIA